MNCIRGFLVLGLALPVVATGHEGPDQPPTPAQKYQALLKDFQLASSGIVRSDQERLTFIGRTFKLRNKLALEFVELAEQVPEGPGRRRCPDPGGLAGERNALAGRAGG